MNPLYLGLALTALVLVSLVLWFLRRFDVIGGGGGGSSGGGSGGGGGGSVPPRPGHIAGFLEKGQPWFSCHMIFAPKNAGREQAIIDSALAHGWTTLYIMALLEKDYGGLSVRYTHDQQAHWRKWMAEIRRRGLKIVLWVRSDDSPGADKWSDAQYLDFARLLHDDLGDLVDEWVSALEADEYWTESRCQHLNRELRKLVAPARVGCHITPRLDHIGWCAGADVAYIQPGFSRGPAEVAAYCRDAATRWPGPIVCAEYDLVSSSPSAQAKGDAAAKAHARIIGVGTGCGDEGRRILAARAP